MLVYQGENVTLSCSATGFPEPVIGWLKGNLSISNLSSNGGNSCLVLYAVKKEAANGEYKCVARNSLGEIFSLEGTVTVLTRQKTRGKAFVAIYYQKNRISKGILVSDWFFAILFVS